MHIDVVLYPGFDELDAIAPYQVFKVAAAAGADLQVEFVSLDGPSGIVAAFGSRMWSTAALGERDEPTMILVPGGGWVEGSRTGVRSEIERGLLPRRLAELYAKGAELAAVCTGAMLLAAAGLMQGRPGTTHHKAQKALAAAGAKIVPARVVDTGRIITSGGKTSGLDLAMWVVERFAGPEMAREVEAHLEFERRGTVWRVS